jgi:hypothetical protein
MRLRVGIGVDYLAAALVTLAVFGLPAWVVVLADGDDATWWLIALVLALALTAPATRRLVDTGRLLSSLPKSVVLLLCSAFLTWFAAVIALYLAYAIEVNSSLCGGGTAAAVAFGGGIAVFTAVGALGLASRRFVLMWAMPLAPALGFAWAVLSFAVLPGGHGYCET